MMTEEELKTLKKKAEELKQTADDMEAKLASKPANEKIAAMREQMKQLLAEMRRMEKNVRNIIEREQDNKPEEEHENGND